MMSNSLPIVNSSDRVFTPEEVAAAAHERVLLLELCLKWHQSAERETASAAAAEPHPQESVRYRYPSITKTSGTKAKPNGKFTLRVMEGEITDSQIIVVLGIQGTGKSNFFNMVAPTLKPVESSNGEIPKLPKLAFKHRKNFLNKIPVAITVRDLLNQKIRDSCMNPKFVHNVMEPLHINNILMDKLVNDLSPGEAQTVALCLCLGKPADIYLIDIPSAYLDMPQRIATSKVIKWFMRHEKKAAFVIEHNFMVASYLADRIIVVEGQPCIDCIASAPGPVLAGADLYLSQLKIGTFLEHKRVKTMMKLVSTEIVEDRHIPGCSYYRDDFNPFFFFAATSETTRIC